FSLALRPGSYEITGWGRAPGSGLLLPPSPENTTIPFGALFSTISIHVVRQVGVTGTLLLPSGVGPANVTVELSSASQNLTISGSQFLTRFLASPGTFTYYAAAPGANRSYAAVGSLTVDNSGTISSSIDLSGTATRVVANLTRPVGGLLDANVTVAIVGPGGLALTAVAHSGQLTALLPSGSSYGFAVATTQLVATASGSIYQSFVVVPGYTCAVGGATMFCNVPLVATPVLSGVTGTLTYPGFPSSLAGEVQFVGPSPSTNATTVAVENGSFSVALAPGTYSVYATAGGAASPVANLTDVVVGASPGLPLSIGLAPTWVEALTLTPPSGGVLGNAEVRVSSPGGTVLKLADEPFGSMLTIALPTGVYTISASAPASPYGVATNASATTTVSLLSGNAATHLTLDYQFTRTASIVLTAPTSAALGNGGMATFSYVVTNTGNAPEVLHFTGSPSTFNFTFAPSNVSLGTAGGNRSVGGEVTIRVPVGTIVDHPTVTFEALLPNGQPAGFATPTPSISLTPYYALSLGGGAASSSSVSPYSASLAFYVRNPGTATEFVRMSVADATRLAGLGWTSKILQGKSTVPSSISIAAAGNTTFVFQLASPAAQALPPGT
ncbi:MAG: hypothetical protein L3J73_05535, partial [Thermoplasmata archaeon]|nr:hypothetical protein [Thermoplasmata archaeon]